MMEELGTIMEKIWVMVVGSLVAAAGVTASEEAMFNVTKRFVMGLEECKKELNVGDHIMQDFFNFWREDYELVSRDTGCVLLCIANKLGLVDADMKMHHGNAHEFAKNHGADDEVAKQLITLVHDCEKANEGVEDHCARVLEVAKCFRTKIHGLKWAPSMTDVLEEVMTAM